MGKYISCGKIGKFDKYILISVFFGILSLFVYGYNYNNSFKNLRIYFTDTQKQLFEHKLIQKMYCFIATFFFSLITYKFESKEDNKYILTKRKILPEQYYSSTNLYLISLFITFLLVFIDFAKSKYMDLLKDLDFWMIELIIINYFNIKMFNIKIYKHQIFSFEFTIIPCILKMVTIFLSFINYDNKVQKILYMDYRFLIPIGIVVYFILLTINSYALTKLKWLIDLRYIKISKLLILYGIVGTIFYIIMIVISTFINCDSVIKDNICHIYDKNNNSYYLENFILYIKTFKGNIGEIFIEIIVNLFGVICFFCNKYFKLLIIKYLSPIHIIFLIPIEFIIKKIIAPINTIIREGSFFTKNKMQNVVTKYILDISGDFLSTLGFMIYLEIIELNFCGFNYDIKKEIYVRSLSESITSEMIDKKFVYLNDGDIEEKSIDSEKNDNLP